MSVALDSIGGGVNSPYVRSLARNRLLGPKAPTAATSVGTAPVMGLQPFQTTPLSATANSLGQMSPPPVVPKPPPAPPPNPAMTQYQYGNLLPGNIDLYGGGLGGTLNGILRNFLGFGSFSPSGSPFLLDMLRSNALQDAQGQRGHAALLAENLGTDPATAASHGLLADLQAEGGVSRATSEAMLRELLAQQGFGQSLLGGVLGKQGLQNAGSPGFDIGSILSLIGQLGGAALGPHP